MRYNRDIEHQIKHTLKNGKNVLLLGARQTGKTTLVKSIPHERYINLMDPELRLRYESRPNILMDELKAIKKNKQSLPLIIIDEIQKVPDLTDIIQVIIDDKIASFIVTGSSVRKIKNLLPGRVIKFQMLPLAVNEIIEKQIDIELILRNGMLPEVYSNGANEDNEQLLASYVSLYLEEEIRKEALVRNLGTFSNFLRLASIESGNTVSFRAISQEVGVSHTTISEYYNILEDCMIVEKIEPLIKTNSRRKLNKSPKYLMFDLGVRRLGAKESHIINEKDLPNLFEQFIGLELIKGLKNRNKNSQILFWRDHAGPEVDYVLEESGLYTPIKVKWTKIPTLKDARHIIKFQQEYNSSTNGYIVCRTPFPVQLTDTIVAISWRELAQIYHLG